MVLQVGENSKSFTAEVANWSPNVFYLCRIALVINYCNLGADFVTQLASSLLHIPLAIEHHGSPE